MNIRRYSAAPLRSRGIVAGLALILLTGAILWPGCSREETENATTPDTLPQRIICMAPNIAETVFALGEGDRVVGVSEFTAYPPEAAARPQVGALYNANLERIVSLRPDLILIQQKHETVEKLCADRHIPFLIVNMERGLESVLAAIETLGETLDASERAEVLRKEIKTDLTEIRAGTEGMHRTRVLICVDRSQGSLKSIYCPGGPSFLTELVHIAGGENVFANETNAYVQVSTEAIVQRAPEVIIETVLNRDLSDAERKKIVDEWAVLDTVPAVKQGRIYVLTEDHVVVPGPRIGKTARLLSETLHPEPSDAR